MCEGEEADGQFTSGYTITYKRIFVTKLLNKVARDNIHIWEQQLRLVNALKKTSPVAVSIYEDFNYRGHAEYATSVLEWVHTGNFYSHPLNKTKQTPSVPAKCYSYNTTTVPIFTDGFRDVHKVHGEDITTYVENIEEVLEAASKWPTFEDICNVHINDIAII